ncbi:hypothetical protein [Heyndrickxia acidicola]|uniref:Uncharacterized protein n=1 Tax=Heyndrickxia acidicola TaxID=209389 RepID=A0ABU6MNC7_9BACI|nr:hypothetical protein [Heyndrickxia acidicola]MED1205829.1 hypothetical protein [Heyndrickxia acidicola]
MTNSHDDDHEGKSIVDEKSNPSNQELENSSTGYGLETVTIKPEKSSKKSDHPNPGCGGL